MSCRNNACGPARKNGQRRSATSRCVSMTKLPAVVSIRVRKTAGACEEWNKEKANKSASRRFIRFSVARLSCDSWHRFSQYQLPVGVTSPLHSKLFRQSLDSRISLVIYSRNDADHPKSPQNIRTTPQACPAPTSSGVLRNSCGAGRDHHAGVPCDERRG